MQINERVIIIGETLNELFYLNQNIKKYENFNYQNCNHY